LSNDEDYYDVLGVARDADQRAIKDAFRRLALQFHPDRNKEPGAEERFKKIAEAYAVLSDPGKRADYDAHGFAGVAGLSPEDLFGGVDFGDMFGGLGFDFGGGLFDRLFGRRRAPGRGANIEFKIAVPLEKIAAGGEQTVSVSRPAVCAACRGKRTEGGIEPKRCTACGGTGQHVATKQQRGVVVRQITTCEPCAGRGTIIDKPCTACGGAGEVVGEESLTVRIPPGAEDGMALRIAGHGMPSPVVNGAPGDLYVIVYSAPDPRFERQGADLYRTQSLDLVDAVLGTSMNVPTLDGSAEIRVPAGTQPNQIFRIRGKGLPRFGDARRGDIYVRVSIHIPERLSANERALYEQLRERSHPRARPRPS
jgi:molecular chaperone DnaJ